MIHDGTTCLLETGRDAFICSKPHVKKKASAEQSTMTSPSSYHHRQRRETPPPCLRRTCADKREGHLAAWAITATTSHLSIPRGATHYEPTCQLPTCLFHVSVDAHRSSNSQLVWGRKKKNFEPTVIEYLKKSLIKGWEWEINQKFKS